MMFRKLRDDHEPRLMIIPMIDIIFFMLVFFMMSTLYMTEQNLIPVQLPQAAAQKLQTETSITVTVLENGSVAYQDERISLEELKNRLKAELTAAPDKPFILRADKNTDYGHVVAVIDEIKQAGVVRMAIATEAK